ncbi:MAG TPA: hypothetical protein PKA20_28265 [Burkholderiaceae bacterium]|nr:hypothetical protein [Burkholderiaceae bacterium]
MTYNDQLIDRLMGRFRAHVAAPHVLERIEQTLREAAESIGEHDVQVRLDDVGATVTLRGRGPTLRQRVARMFS